MAFTVLVLFTECLGWTFVKFTAFVAFMRRSGWSFCGVQSVCSVYGALGLDPCGIYSVSSVYGALAFGTCLAFVCFFILSIRGCLRVWRIGAQASPSHEPFLSELGIQLGGPFGLAWGLMAGGARVCQPWGRNAI